MPELPEIVVYAECLQLVAGGQQLEQIRLASPFVLRTVDPPPGDFAGRVLVGTGRIGKRIVLEFSGEHYAVLHLMLAGRLKWRPPGARLAKGSGIAAFDFAAGSLLLTEASTKHRASLHLVSGRDGLEGFRRGGVDVLTSSAAEFGAALRRANSTLKRALTDPTIVDGIGNTFSDETLHRARLSPFALTGSLSDAEMLGLYQAARDVLGEWIARLRGEAGDGWLNKVTSRRPEFAVHGRYGQACPACGAPVQRIVYADNEANYCPGCQTGGRILADRSLSRLLKDDWPRTLEELERTDRGKPGRSQPS